MHVIGMILKRGVFCGERGIVDDGRIYRPPSESTVDACDMFDMFVFQRWLGVGDFDSRSWAITKILELSFSGVEKSLRFQDYRFLPLFLFPFALRLLNLAAFSGPEDALSALGPSFTPRLAASI